MTLPPKSLAGVTPSPCVRLCTLDDNDVCVGCGRTLDDIKDWTKMSEPDKAACVERARQRLQAMGRPLPPIARHKDIGEA
jgi:predicted Fe-S protein YdhL (DUF1289 family)